MNDQLLGPVVLDLKGLSLDKAEKELLCRPMVGGVILFSRNFYDQAQLSALITELRSVRPDILIAVDQEGGRVQRLRSGFTRIPPMQVLGRLCHQDSRTGLALTRDCGWLMAAELLAWGIDISFAPVLDLDDQYSDVIGDRSFSPDPNLVIVAAAAFMEGMHEAGMATTGKHFPGHGSVKADSHLELPIDQRPLDAVYKSDIAPFKGLRQQLDAVMPAHILFPEIDSQLVGFSSFWLQQVLRGDLGFDGVIFSDDLSMGGAASAGSFTDRADLALRAGCDAVLICNCPDEAATVVAHLEQLQQPLSRRLARMRSAHSAVPSWSALLADERRQTTQEQLGNL